MELLLISLFLAVKLVEGKEGFISIDCGYVGEDYTDSHSTITYVSDINFIDTGYNYTFTDTKITWHPFVTKQDTTLRYFPTETGIRNCYYISNGISKGIKYLIRASFLYGNYDGKNNDVINKLFQFDLYLGVDKWQTINFTQIGEADLSQFWIRAEIISIAKHDYLSICLINTNQGVPFINSIEIRPIDDQIYIDVNQSVSLVLSQRYALGLSKYTYMKSLTYGTIRYPEDKYDRIWVAFDPLFFLTLSTNSTIINVPNDPFQVPSKVMQYAISPYDRFNRLANRTLNVPLTPQFNDTFGSLYVYMHFAEINVTNIDRNFIIEGYPNVGVITPKYLVANHVRIVYDVVSTSTNNFINLTQASNFTLPPLINAIESYYGVNFNGVTTNEGDVMAIMSLKWDYNITIWQDDPCLFQWTGVQCNNSNSSSPRIISLILSKESLSGTISDALENLTALQYIDLSYNDLIGSIPSFFSYLTMLHVLNLSHNHLTGSIPIDLLNKQANGSLIIVLDHNCLDGQKCKTKLRTSTIIGIAVAGSIVVLVIVALTIYVIRKRRKQTNELSSSDQHNLETEGENNDSDSLNSADREFCQFTYADLKLITNNFERIIGEGDSMTVYYGRLRGRIEVAVKLYSQTIDEEMSTDFRSFLSHSTKSANYKKFNVEVQVLSKIHHENLVSLIGCCNDIEHLAIVYEYLSEGTLKDHLTGKYVRGKVLSWRTRLQIAIDVARGLEYLHKDCIPAIIHRDIKSNNILLNHHHLEAKIADFGLSKFLLSDANSHASTNVVVGTPGYIDPEYHKTFHVSEKSDVYSFGVVLLELITALPAVLEFPQSGHIVQIVHQKLNEDKNISEIADPKLAKQYDEKSIKKVIALALSCTLPVAASRPNMTEIITQLRENLKLEIIRINQSVEINKISSSLIKEQHSSDSKEILSQVNIAEQISVGR